MQNESHGFVKSFECGVIFKPNTFVHRPVYRGELQPVKIELPPEEGKSSTVFVRPFSDKQLIPCPIMQFGKAGEKGTGLRVALQNEHERPLTLEVLPDNCIGLRVFRIAQKGNIAFSQPVTGTAEQIQEYIRYRAVCGQAFLDYISFRQVAFPQFLNKYRHIFFNETENSGEIEWEYM